MFLFKDSLLKIRILGLSLSLMIQVDPWNREREELTPDAR